MNKNLRDHLFYFADQILPRRLALLPYSMALSSVKENASSNLPGCEVWERNSIKRGNYVFGLSDLDLTFYANINYSREELSQFFSNLNRIKTLYPFIGEVNFYFSSLAQQLIGSVNFYELNRDPVLKKKIIVSNFDYRIDGLVFILRMLYSDKFKLSESPYLRHKKWSAHLSDVFGTSLQSTHTLNFKFVQDYLLRGMELETKFLPEFESVMTILADPNFDEATVFDRKMPEIWKYLFPHRYIWFAGKGTEDFQAIKNTLLGDICLRQIDWEVWGLMTQLPFLQDNKYGFRIHLERLQIVAQNLDDSDDVSKRISVLLDFGERFFN